MTKMSIHDRAILAMRACVAPNRITLSPNGWVEVRKESASLTSIDFQPKAKTYMGIPYEIVSGQREDILVHGEESK